MMPTLFLSTLSLRRATQWLNMISSKIDISIHALLAESDRYHLKYDSEEEIFLSTLSLRRATASVMPSHMARKYFYPRSPCGERLQVNCRIKVEEEISIHALLAESDNITCKAEQNLLQFLSTLSLRRATRCAVHLHEFYRISIHALLAESD